MNWRRRPHVKREELLEHVKQSIHEIAPDADIILYGSRARGDAHPESDWDFLILLDGVVDDARTDAIRHRLYDIEWECARYSVRLSEAAKNGTRLCLR
jgi:uncharacterized protein